MEIFIGALILGLVVYVVMKPKQLPGEKETKEPSLVKEVQPSSQVKSKVDFDELPEVVDLRRKISANEKSFETIKKEHEFLRKSVVELPRPDIDVLAEYLKNHKEFFNSLEVDMVLGFQKINEYLNKQMDNLKHVRGVWEKRELLFRSPSVNDDISYVESSLQTDDIDVLFEEAARLVVASQNGSTSLIQRKLKLGYNRAGRIVDQLEAAGVLGPFEGSTPRKVLISNESSLKLIIENNGGNVGTSDSIAQDKSIIQLKRELTKRPVFESSGEPRDVTIDDLGKEYEATVKQYQNLNRVTALGVLMADALVNNDKLLYTKLYARLDKLSMFESNWERKVDRELSDINENLKKLNTSILDLLDHVSGMEENIVSAIEDLSWEMSDAFANIEQSVDEKVGKVNEQIEKVRSDVSSVHGAVGLNTMLTAYNSYQLNRIRNN